MKIFSFILMLMLPIAPGLSGESHYEFPPEDGFHTPASSSTSKCHLSQIDCVAREERLYDIYSHLFSFPSKQINYYKVLRKYWDVLPSWFEIIQKIYGQQSKRRTISENSLLFMKLNALLNRKSESSQTNVPSRYRRIGIRLGSEFLGKRSSLEAIPFGFAQKFPKVSSPNIRKSILHSVAADGQRQETFNPTSRANSEVKMIRKMGTELLGKRWDTEMLGKRNVELLGKRGLELLGKRGTELRGKKSTFLRQYNYVREREPKLPACNDEKVLHDESHAGSELICTEFDIHYGGRRKICREEQLQKICTLN